MEKTPSDDKTASHGKTTSDGKTTTDGKTTSDEITTGGSKDRTRAVSSPRKRVAATKKTSASESPVKKKNAPRTKKTASATAKRAPAPSPKQASDGEPSRTDGATPLSASGIDKDTPDTGPRDAATAALAEAGQVVDKTANAAIAPAVPRDEIPKSATGQQGNARGERPTWMPSWTWVDRWASFLTPIFNGLSRLRVIAAVCVGVVAILAFMPGFTTIPPVDRDESRFAQASRQMVDSGDYVEIRFQNGPRYQKPIGIYWLQSIALNMYGAEDGKAPIWVYRTVSFAGAVAAALLTYWLALAFGSPPVALASGLLVALTILLGAEARLAKTDAMLFASILVAQAILARAFLARRDSAVKGWHATLFWTAAAAGILIKGPVLPMVVGTTAALASLFERRAVWLRRLRPGLGVMWMLILTLPWFIAIGITSAGEFYAQSIGGDFLEKIAESRERPFIPPGTFTFGFFPGLGWPLAPFAFLAIPFAMASWNDKSTRFLVAWIVPTWLIFEFAATKLPHYILPIYPALAILAARMIVYEKVPSGWMAGLAKALYILIPAAAFIGIPVVLYVYGDTISPYGMVLTTLGFIGILGAFLLLLRSHAKASLMATVAATLVLYAGTFAFHVPNARTIWITPQLVTALDGVRCENPQLATLGYNEPSLILMTRTDLRLLGTAEAAAEFLGAGPCRAAFVDAPYVDAMFDELAGFDPQSQTAAQSVRLLARVDGVNINGGDELDMHVFAAGE